MSQHLALSVGIQTITIQIRATINKGKQVKEEPPQVTFESRPLCSMSTEGLYVAPHLQTDSMLSTDPIHPHPTGPSIDTSMSRSRPIPMH